METLHAIRTLRVVREFRDDPLPAETLDAILDAGRHAGSSKNLQRWTFISITDRGTLRQLAEVGDYAGHLAGAAAAVAIVTPSPSAGMPLSVTWDSGRAAQNMALAGWALGVGSAPATVYRQGLARTILGYPEDQHCEYLLSLGYPADPGELNRPPRAGGRRGIEEVVRREHW